MLSRLCLETGTNACLYARSHDNLVIPTPLQAPVGRSFVLGLTLDVRHSLWLGVVPGEEGVVAEASKAVGTWCLGLRSLHFLLDQLEIHNAWNHRLFLEPGIPVAPWKVLWFLLGLRFCLWTKGGWLKRGEGCFLWLTRP